MKAIFALILAAPLLYSQEASQPDQPPAALKEVVADYWKGLAEGDKARALEHVHPQTLNAFLKRSEPALQGWSVESYQRLRADRFQVTTAFQSRLPAGGLAPSKIRETWELTGQGWKVRVLSLEEQRQKARQALQRPAVMPVQLQVLPEALKIRTESGQPGVIVIRNGLHQEVELVDLQYDKRYLEAKLPNPPLLAARTTSRIALYWAGGESADQEVHEQSLEVILVLKVGEEMRRFPIPVRLNPADPLLDWIKGRKAPQKAPKSPPPRPGQ